MYIFYIHAIIHWTKIEISKIGWIIEYFYLNNIQVNLYIPLGMHTLCGDNYLK